VARIRTVVGKDLVVEDVVLSFCRKLGIRRHLAAEGHRLVGLDIAYMSLISADQVSAWVNMVGIPDHTELFIWLVRDTQTRSWSPQKLTVHIDGNLGGLMDMGFGSIYSCFMIREVANDYEFICNDVDHCRCHLDGVFEKPHK
jgi:hypothetical protein